MLVSILRRWRKGPMSELIIPVATKVLLSGLLVLLAGIFVWQAWRIWFNRSLVLSAFDFAEDGKPSAESGEQFARMVRADLVQLAGLYNAGEVANAGAVPTSNSRDPVVPMEIPAEFDTSFFETIELKAYGIEFGSIFKSLRRQLESPSEITGNVTHQGDKYSVFAELRVAGDDADSPQRWSIQYAKDLPEATRNIACRIFRYLASNPKRATADTTLYRTVDDEEFCFFNHALAAYDQYRLRKAVLSDEDAKKLLSEANGPITKLLERDVVTFPYVRKLAALVLFEQKKYADAEREISRYIAWLETEKRVDDSAKMLRQTAQSRKLQVTPAVSRLRPLQPGTSIGTLSGKSAGMVCCIVKDAAGRHYLLSAASVFGSMIGEKIVQPAVKDGGVEADAVAEQEKANSTIAVARMREKIDFDARILELGEIKGFESKPAVDSGVVTYGFDGQRREGKVISTGLSLPIELESGESVPVENATITTNISQGGEIGAPVVTPGGKLVGMIFASGGSTTVVLPIEPALKELKLELVK